MYVFNSMLKQQHPHGDPSLWVFFVGPCPVSLLLRRNADLAEDLRVAVFVREFLVAFYYDRIRLRWTLRWEPFDVFGRVRWMCLSGVSCSLFGLMV